MESSISRTADPPKKLSKKSGGKSNKLKLGKHAFCHHDKHGLTSLEDLLTLPEPPSHDPWEDIWEPVSRMKKTNRAMKSTLSKLFGSTYHTLNHQDEAAQIFHEIPLITPRMIKF
jgi:hypothetical protein